MQNKFDIPIGTVCYKAGGFNGRTTKVIVNDNNQKRVTRFWNSLYFSDKEKADAVTNKEHADYERWLLDTY